MISPLDPRHAPPLMLVTGKGGVGKTTVCALLARRAVAAGRRTLVCGMEVTEALGPMLGAKGPLGHQPQAIGPGLDGVHLDVERAIIEAVARLLPTPRLARRLLDNRALRRFLGTAPGARGFSALEAVTEHLASGRWDQIVVDLPATGHALTLLDAPRALADAVGRGPFAERARRLQARLSDPRDAALTVVTLPEEMPVNETLELADKAAARLHLGPALVVLNQMHAPPAAPIRLPALQEALEALADAPQPTDDQRRWRHQLSQGLQRYHVQSHQRSRLLHGLQGVPLLTLPWQPAAEEGRRLDALLQRLAEDAHVQQEVGA